MRPAASKTGTTDNYRDTWTDGYATNLAIVVWVGNTDGHPMKQALSSMTAGKIWPEAMQASFSLLNLPAEDFPRPDGLSEQQVCGDTALRPGEPPCRQDLFVAGQSAAPTSAPTARATSAPDPTSAPEPTQAQQPAEVPAAPAQQPGPTAAPAQPAPVPPAAPTPAPKSQPTTAPAPAKPAPTPVPPKPTAKPGG